MSVREITTLIKDVSPAPDSKIKRMQKIEQEIRESCSPEAESSKNPKKRNPRSCGHWFVRHRLCIICKSKVDKTEGRAFDYLVKGLLLSHEALALTKRFTTQSYCLKEKKLYLVLDLDHTLLHAINVSRLSKAEKYLLKESAREDLKKMEIDSTEYLTKLRPFLCHFLYEANEMFTMYVYTMGCRGYEKALLELIDPEEVYFEEDRVITGDDSPYVKTLDLVLAEERGVIIVDDTTSVWTHHKSNLVEISKYMYFRDNQDSKPYSEEKRDESENDGGLANVLNLLKEVHCGFFRVKKNQLKSQDVRLLLQEIDYVCI